MNDVDRAERLSEGDPAPDFVLYTDSNDPWQLSEHRDRPVVLLFFPGAFTRVCTTELNLVDSDFDTFGEAHVVGISTDSPFVLSEFRSAQGFDFPLLSDHDAEVSARFGAKYDGNFSPMNLDRIAKRAAFVIDREGIVRYVEVMEDAGELPDFQAIEETLDGLKEGRAE